MRAEAGTGLQRRLPAKPWLARCATHLHYLNPWSGLTFVRSFNSNHPRLIFQTCFGRRTWLRVWLVELLCSDASPSLRTGTMPDGADAAHPDDMDCIWATVESSFCVGTVAVNITDAVDDVLSNMKRVRPRASCTRGRQDCTHANYISCIGDQILYECRRRLYHSIFLDVRVHHTVSKMSPGGSTIWIGCACDAHRRSLQAHWWKKDGLIGKSIIPLLLGDYCPC